MGETPPEDLRGYPDIEGVSWECPPTNLGGADTSSVLAMLELSEEGSLFSLLGLSVGIFQLGQTGEKHMGVACSNVEREYLSLLPVDPVSN